MEYKKMRRIINVAAGKEPADLVLKGASVLNVFTSSFEKTNVAICEGMIAGLGRYEGIEEVDLEGRFLVPGFIDSHMHPESSLILPSEYEKAVLPHGTAAVVADPHEIGNVAGLEGIDFMMDLTKDLTLKYYYTMPSCVPANELEESGATLGREELLPYYDDPDVLGLGSDVIATKTVGRNR